MNLKSYLLTMSTATAICWAIFVFVVFTIDPFVTNKIGFLMFYSSLFLALAGTGAVFGFFIRFVALKNELAFRAVKSAFRQAFLFAFLLVCVLYLNATDLFTWLNLILLVAGLSVLEYFLISYKKFS